jgi:hypothetical protein
MQSFARLCPVNVVHLQVLLLPPPYATATMIIMIALIWSVLSPMKVYLLLP